jgi:hypothetical protein
MCVESKRGGNCSLKVVIVMGRNLQSNRFLEDLPTVQKLPVSWGGSFSPTSVRRGTGTFSAKAVIFMGRNLQSNICQKRYQAANVMGRKLQSNICQKRYRHLQCKSCHLHEAESSVYQMSETVPVPGSKKVNPKLVEGCTLCPQTVKFAVSSVQKLTEAVSLVESC